MYKITETELKEIKKYLEKLKNCIVHEKVNWFSQKDIEKTENIIKSLKENYNIK